MAASAQVAPLVLCSYFSYQTRVHVHKHNFSIKLHKIKYSFCQSTNRNPHLFTKPHLNSLYDNLRTYACRWIKLYTISHPFLLLCFQRVGEFRTLQILSIICPGSVVWTELYLINDFLDPCVWIFCLANCWIFSMELPVQCAHI